MVLTFPRLRTGRLAPGAPDDGGRAPREPARYRAVRRRSIRTTLTTAAILVGLISMLNAVLYLTQSSAAARSVVMLDVIQALSALAVVAAMRTSLRRIPATIAFVYFAVVAAVPLGTLRLQPESVILVAASLALVPIGIALMIAWSNRMFATWSIGYLAIVAGGDAAISPAGLSSSDHWQLIGAVGIGLTVGVFGQRIRERHDRVAFDRERMLGRLVHQSTEQRASLGRLNMELDRVVRREIRGRESIEAALGKIQTGATPEMIGAIACDELIELPTIDAAWVVAFSTDSSHVVAAAGSTTIEVADAAPDDWLRRFKANAATGPWLETNPTGALTTIWSPLRGSIGIIGVIGCGSHDPDAAERVAEMLPAIATFGSMVGALVAPGLETRQTAGVARARIQAILDERSSRPFFQPIVDLRTGAVAGFEALTRFADGSRPDVIFGLATTAGLTVELESATLGAALAASVTLPTGAYVGVNASPELLYAFDLRPLFAGIDRPIVLEITEHVAIEDYALLLTCIERLGPQVTLAVDDAGAGYASLRHILELAPRKVKIDIGLVRGIDADPARQALIAGLGYFAMKRGMELVAEGIETPEELAMIRSLGVDFGQGFLLGRPRDGRDAGPWTGALDPAQFSSAA
jgi:EAL domain-containing protein (putative c-di-GMP-specific phosphodiesterase class I)